MPVFTESHLINGVILAQLQPFGDERGRFIETFRKSWFPQRRWEIVQTNRSDSAAGVLRGLHYHHRQVDYWYPLAGSLRVGLADLRPSSPTYMACQTIDIGADHTQGLFIPIGVAHGFLALTDVTLCYIVDNYYDGADEFGVRWDDPALNVAWGVSHPILSPRDACNPFLQNIPAAHLPH
ncbi:MAG: dTDP-4-dehydrorhamnose 3,5-epimerase family protein [Anaerolineales bacterium]|nr:dTDP-4-dehydrorhamnose 3,5-epimerase family protein [Anaerolineales bacterium]MCB8953679.1 dTDP-4-dehydrorhamnose 3,5-epimerase family protein [Ardenticatenales bacterium]